MSTDWPELPTYELRELADAMSEISEISYAAGWMMGNEETVWELVHVGGAYGMCQWSPEDDEIERVRRAMVAADSWVRWEGRGQGSGLVAVPLAEWRASHPIGRAS